MISRKTRKIIVHIAKKLLAFLNFSEGSYFYHCSIRLNLNYKI